MNYQYQMLRYSTHLKLVSHWQARKKLLKKKIVLKNNIILIKIIIFDKDKNQEERHRMVAFYWKELEYINVYF